ncbi:MAG: acyl-CoA/acyl-ACP dehydrogenase [Firmicutes bacterium]|nr:acyl-CoA/acyl-ACP dehydrogenase [Bacillota bacterium]
MDYRLPEEVRLLRETVRGFVRESVRPLEGAWRPGEGLPAEVVASLQAARRRLGLWGLSAPAGHGGAGLSWLGQAVIQEELQRSPLGLWTLGVFAAGEPPFPMYDLQGEARERYLLPCLEGTRQAHQLVAPGGSGEGNVAVQWGPDGAVIDGALRSVPRVLTADIMLLVVEDGPDAWAFLCDPDLSGYRIGPARGTMGSVELVDLLWEGCRIPRERILASAGPAARRWRAHQQATVLAAGAVGAAQRCLEDALHHVRVRETFGRPLADRQAIQWMLADSARELHAARLLVYRAASLADAGLDAASAARRAKVFATTVATRIVDRVIQMHGAYGYSQDLPFERFWRELRFYAYAEGDNRELLEAEADGLVADLIG